MYDNNKRKRKRTKLECLLCGSSFDHDYRRKHEIKMHGGNHVKVKLDIDFERDQHHRKRLKPKKIDLNPQSHVHYQRIRTL